MIMWLPEKPITFIGMMQRSHAATGSYDLAMDTKLDDYNGHPVMMSFNPEAVGGAVWTSHYSWAGLEYIGRGKFVECLKPSIGFYERGGMGSSLVVTTHGDPNQQANQIEFLLHEGFIQFGGQVTRDENRERWDEWKAIAFWYRERRNSHDAKLAMHIQTSIEKGIEFPEPLPQTPQTHPRQIERWVRSLDVGRASRVAG